MSSPSIQPQMVHEKEVKTKIKDKDNEFPSASFRGGAGFLTGLGGVIWRTTAGNISDKMAQNIQPCLKRSALQDSTDKNLYLWKWGAVKLLL